MGAFSRIQAVIACARRTFPMQLGASEAHLEELRTQMNELTMRDAESLVDVSRLIKPAHEGNRPVAIFVHIYDDPTFTLGLIALQPKALLPLHDHPQMSGFIKVVAGRLRVRSFTPMLLLPGGHNVAQLEKDVEISANDLAANATGSNKSQVLTLGPTLGNLHEIETANSDAGGAFFDLLSPPYSIEDGTRPCRYYQVSPTERPPDNSSNSTKKLFDLTEITEPDFACASIDCRELFSGR